MDRSDLQVRQLVRVIADGKVGTVEQIGSLTDHAFVAINGRVSKFAFSELEDASGKKPAASEGGGEAVSEPFSDEEVLRAFSVMDVNNDGSISPGELADILQKLDSSKWSGPLIDKLFVDMDSNADNRIQFEEFLQWARGKGGHSLQSVLIGKAAPIHGLVDAKPLMMEQDWFSELFGFSETSYHTVQRWLKVSQDPPVLESLVNHRKYRVGHFSTPTLRDLQQQCSEVELPGKLKLRNVVGSVDEFLAAEENRHATFQVASQFNCLETMSPTQYPEEGVGCYSKDRTQGPACSIACGPATVFRNYFVPIDAESRAAELGSLVQRGQTQDYQIDNLAEVGQVLGNDPHGKLFQVRTGWVLADDEQLEQLNTAMGALSSDRLDQLRAALRFGIHRDTQVTSCKFGERAVHDPQQLVTQVCTSACPTNASATRHLWASFAKLILEAAYEAVFWAALLSAQKSPDAPGSRRIFLTCLGGGAFGNSWHWITGALRTTMARFKDYDLDVRIVCHKGPVDQDLVQLASDVNSGSL